MAAVELVLVVSPGAGGGTGGAALAGALRARGARVRLAGIAELDGLALDGAERLVIASGDGAIGPAAQRAAAAGIPLAVIASGTANDFARAARIPRGRDAAVRLAADAAARTLPFDLGVLAGHGDQAAQPFVNVAACGLSACAARRSDGLKGALGPLAYPVGAVLAAGAARPLPTRVVVDGEERFHGPAWQVLVAATGAFGGGVSVGPVDLDDERLDVAILAARGRRRLAVHALSLLAGRLTEEHDVHHHRGARIEVDAPGPWNVDGERDDTPGPRRLSVDALVDVVVPGG